MRTRTALLAIVAGIGCAAEVGPPSATSAQDIRRLYAASGEPIVGRLKTNEGLIELTAGAFAQGGRAPRNAYARRAAARAELDVGALDAEVDRSLLKPADDPSMRSFRD
jgi:hypothetical protein